MGSPTERDVSRREEELPMPLPYELDDEREEYPREDRAVESRLS